MPPELTTIQAAVLARLTDEWQPEYMLVGRKLGGNYRTLDTLVRHGLVEPRLFRNRDYIDYRLAQKG